MVLIKGIPIKSTANLINISKNVKFRTKTIQVPDLGSINMSFASYEVSKSQQTKPAPPLIIMHGLFGSKRNWNSLSKAFHQNTTPQRKIISVDARNHGDSPHRNTHSYPLLAEDIKTLLLQLGIKRAALLGHSMGGRAMMYFTLKYPEFVDKLIVCDISPVSTSPDLYTIPSIFSAVEGINLPRDISITEARTLCDSQLSKNIKGKNLRSFLLTNLAKRADGSYAWTINIPALATNFAENIAVFPEVGGLKFNGPVMFVAGGESDYIQQSDYTQILKMFPRSDFQVIPGAGHWVHSEKPKDFLEVCIGFLNKKHI